MNTRLLLKALIQDYCIVGHTRANKIFILGRETKDNNILFKLTTDDITKCYKESACNCLCSSLCLHLGMKDKSELEQLYSDLRYAKESAQKHEKVVLDSRSLEKEFGHQLRTGLPHYRDLRRLLLKFIFWTCPNTSKIEKNYVYKELIRRYYQLYKDNQYFDSIATETSGYNDSTLHNFPRITDDGTEFPRCEWPKQDRFLTLLDIYYFLKWTYLKYHKNNFYKNEFQTNIFCSWRDDDEHIMMTGKSLFDGSSYHLAGLLQDDGENFDFVIRDNKLIRHLHETDLQMPELEIKYDSKNDTWIITSNDKTEIRLHRIDYAISCTMSKIDLLLKNAFESFKRIALSHQYRYFEYFRVCSKPKLLYASLEWVLYPNAKEPIGILHLEYDLPRQKEQLYLTQISTYQPELKQLNSTELFELKRINNSHYIEYEVLINGYCMIQVLKEL